MIKEELLIKERDANLQRIDALKKEIESLRLQIVAYENQNKAFNWILEEK